LCAGHVWTTSRIAGQRPDQPQALAFAAPSWSAIFPPSGIRLQRFIVRRVAAEVQGCGDADTRNGSLTGTRRAPRRLAIVLVIGAASDLLLGHWLPMQTRLLIGWSPGAIAYLALAWMAVARADPAMTRIRAQTQDQSGYVIFLLIVTAASASFVAIGFIAGDIKGLPFWQRTEQLTLSVAALLLSWLLIQTLFGFHYARLYYMHHPDAATHWGGLKFPGDREPDYLDFAYYVFVVGMTSQVSDVAVLTRRMRRLTLVHVVLSFIYNIAILAMSMNIIGGAI
jgi:uncharacterized membrane protein